MVCLLFISLMITMHQGQLVDAEILSLLGMLWGVCGIVWFSFLCVRAQECWEHQETTGWIWSPKSSFLAVFHFFRSHLGRGTLQHTGFARLHSVSPQILQTQKMWAEESPRVGWSLITVAIDPSESVHPGSGNAHRIGGFRETCSWPELPGVP